jgi:hypothetical protein
MVFTPQILLLIMKNGPEFERWISLNGRMKLSSSTRDMVPLRGHRFLVTQPDLEYGW